MDPAYIHRTALGKATRESYHENIYHGKEDHVAYQWYYGGDTRAENLVMAAFVEVTGEGGDAIRVRDAPRYNQARFWDGQESGIPRGYDGSVPFPARTLKPGGTEWKGGQEEDGAFDVSPFANEEDFYDEYHEDFFDFEEAEDDYWSRQE